MTQVDRITEDISHMPVAAFIFRDKESDKVHYSSNIRQIKYKITRTTTSLSRCLLLVLIVTGIKYSNLLSWLGVIFNSV